MGLIFDSTIVFLLTWIIWSVLRFRLVYWPKVSHIPGRTTFVLPGQALSFLLPEKWPISDRFSSGPGETAFKENIEKGSTVLRKSGIFSPACKSTFYVSDAVALQEMLSKPEAFVRPVEQYEILDIFGTNVVCCIGPDHKRQRRIAAPAFAEANMPLVWEESFRALRDWQEHVLPKAGDSQHDGDVPETTRQWALTIITAALFGVQSSWAEGIDVRPPKNHTFAFRAALEVVLENVVFRILTPKIFYKLPFLPESWGKKLKLVDAAFADVEHHFNDYISDYRSERAHEGKTLFEKLMAAREAEESGGQGISDTELKGNLFIFYVAGHETSSHTVAFALGLLALHVETQEALFEEVSRLWPSDGAPGYESFSSFTYAQAFLNETLRMYPPVAYVPKRAVGDQVLTRVDLKTGERIPFAIPDGTWIGIHSVGIHYNTLYWDEPLVFRPERFIDKKEYRWPRHAFFPFSAGPHNCIGQRLAQVEMIAMLVYISVHFRVKLPSRSQRRPDETMVQHQARVLANIDKITLTPTDLGLIFERRS